MKKMLVKRTITKLMRINRKRKKKTYTIGGNVSAGLNCSRNALNPFINNMLSKTVNMINITLRMKNPANLFLLSLII
jgi:hypothetical protein